MTPHRFKITSVAAALVPFFHHAVGENITPLQVGDYYATNISSLDLDSETHTYTLSHEGASYLSVHLKIANFPSSCYLETADANGKQSHHFTNEDQSVWGPGVRGDTMLLTLHCNNDIEHDAFVIDEYAAGYPNIETNTETTCGEEQRKNAKCYDGQKEYEMAKSVAVLEWKGIYRCTGWLIKSEGQNLAITNSHCIDSVERVKDSWFVFNYEHDSCSGEKIESYERFKVLELVKINRNAWIDMSLVRLEKKPGAQFGELELADYKLDASQRIYIPQHPYGRPKQIAIDGEDNKTCSVWKYTTSNTGGVTMRYTCDTNPGSSGSPVLDDNHKVVGLHRWGGGCDDGNGATPAIKFIDDIREFITTDEIAECRLDEYEENGICIRCKVTNCKTRRCSGPGKADKNCLKCNPGYKIATNSQGGTWCKRACGGDQFYDTSEGKCMDCPNNIIIVNCKEQFCTKMGHRNTFCRECKDEYDPVFVGNKMYCSFTKSQGAS